MASDVSGAFPTMLRSPLPIPRSLLPTLDLPDVPAYFVRAKGIYPSIRMKG